MDKIEDRKKQAERRTIHLKLNTIAENLGKKHQTNTYEENTFTTKEGNVYKDNNFKIDSYHVESIGDYGGYDLTLSSYIEFKGKCVFEYSHGIKKYIPGAWENKLNYLNRKAKKEILRKDYEHEQKQIEIENKHKKEIADERKKVTDDWGL